MCSLSGVEAHASVECVDKGGEGGGGRVNGEKLWTCKSDQSLLHESCHEVKFYLKLI